MTIESVDQLMANRNGTSIGAKNRLPYRIAGQQAQGERRQPSPVPDREPCHRHDGGEPSEAEQEGHGVPDRDRARRAQATARPR